MKSEFLQEANKAKVKSHLICDWKILTTYRFSYTALNYMQNLHNSK